MTMQSQRGDDTEVVIVGAGPTGLTLACDLARRGVRFRLLEKSAEPFNGSRGKGIQPRTLEIFDDLGVSRQLLRAGTRYPKMNVHLGLLRLKWNMMKRHRRTPDVPFGDVWLVPQWRTEQVLRDRLAELGHGVEWGSEVLSLEQDDGAVSLDVQRGGVTRTIVARYAVGADGGKSFVRKHLGVQFIGTTSQEGRMIVGDLRVEGLSRDYWHVWPRAKGGMVGLCPLPHSELFQLMMTLPVSDQDPELSEQAIHARWMAATGIADIRLYAPTWLSVFRPNVRLVERYRVGRVLLAGDAAHIHTPAGAQGLNTGIQDAYNLGWKLALTLKGAPASLLDSYQEERLPVAASVLELSSELFNGVRGARMPTLTRGDKERQLLLNYRGGPLAVDAGAGYDGPLRAGDRAPDAPCATRRDGQTSVFDRLRGPHFTVLAFGTAAIGAVRRWRHGDGGLARVCAVWSDYVDGDVESLVDQHGEARRAYGVGERDNVVFLVRPDGYVGLIATGDWAAAIDQYMAMITGESAKV